MNNYFAKTGARLLRAALAGGIVLCTAPAYAGDIHKDRHSLSGVNMAHLENVQNMSMGHDFSKTMLESHSEPGVGLGLSYTLKFGQDVRSSEKYGTAGLNFNSSWEGRTAFLPLAEMSFGETQYSGYDRFGLGADQLDQKSAITIRLMGQNIDRYSADDEGEEGDAKKDGGGTDAGDIGLILGGTGLLLLGGTVAVLAAS